MEKSHTTESLIAEIIEPQATQEQVATAYGCTLRTKRAIDWQRVHEVIQARWGYKGYARVRMLAWNAYYDEVPRE